MPGSRQSWSDPTLWIGLVGSCLMAWGATNHRFSYAGAWGWGPVDAMGASTTDSSAGWLVAAGVMSVVAAWWLRRPWRERRHRSADLPTLALWALPLVLVPPVMTADPFAYADMGWIVHASAHPDLAGFGDLSGPYASSVDPVWIGTGLPYPPGAAGLAYLGVAVTGFHPFWGVIAQRAVAILSVLLLGVLVPRIATRRGTARSWATWFGLLNPFVLVLLVGGAHNDSVMVALVVVAVGVVSLPTTERLQHRLVASGVVGVAALVKPQALVALLAVAVPSGDPPDSSRRRSGLLASAALRTAAGLVVAGLVVVAGHLLGQRSWTWVQNSLGPSAAPSLSPVLIVSELLQRLAGMSESGSVRVAQWVVLGLVVASVGLLAVAMPHRPVELAAWTALLLPLAAGSLRPWYLTLGIVLLSLTALPRSIGPLLSAVLMGYLVADSAVSALGWSGGPDVALGAAVALAMVVVDRSWTPLLDARRTQQVADPHTTRGP